MNQTSHTLLFRVHHLGDADAWVRLVGLYRPFVHGWLRRRGVAEADADDLTQDVMAVLVKELPKFAHNGRPGAFRTWLREITSRRGHHFWRTRGARPIATGDGPIAGLMERLVDGRSDLSRLWDEEHNQYLVARALKVVAAEFEPRQCEAFLRLAHGGVKAAEVAAAFGVRVGTVYSWHSRIAARLREELEGLID